MPFSTENQRVVAEWSASPQARGAGFCYGGWSSPVVAAVPPSRAVQGISYTDGNNNRLPEQLFGCPGGETVSYSLTESILSHVFNEKE